MARTCSSGDTACLGHPRHLEFAAAGVMCGSRPLPEVVTRSTGTDAFGFSDRSWSVAAVTRSINGLLVGPRFDPPEAWHRSRRCRRRGPRMEVPGPGELLADHLEPITLPSRTIRLPFA